MRKTTTSVALVLTFGCGAAQTGSAEGETVPEGIAGPESSGTSEDVAIRQLYGSWDVGDQLWTFRETRAGVAAYSAPNLTPAPVVQGEASVQVRDGTERALALVINPRDAHGHYCADLRIEGDAIAVSEAYDVIESDTGRYECRGAPQGSMTREGTRRRP